MAWGGGILWLMEGRRAAQVYEKHSEELVRFATFLTGPADAQDAVSAAMVKVLAEEGWESVSNVRSYLYRMVLNEVRMERRALKRRRARERRSAHREPAPEVPEPRPEVLAAVAQLSPRQRAVVYLTYWDDRAPDSRSRRCWGSQRARSGAISLARARSSGGS